MHFDHFSLVLVRVYMSITSGIPNQISKNTIWKAKITKWLPEVKFEKPEKKSKKRGNTKKKILCQIMQSSMQMFVTVHLKAINI